MDYIKSRNIPKNFNIPLLDFLNNKENISNPAFHSHENLNLHCSQLILPHTLANTATNQPPTQFSLIMLIKING